MTFDQTRRTQRCDPASLVRSFFVFPHLSETQHLHQKRLMKPKAAVRSCDTAGKRQDVAPAWPSVFLSDRVFLLDWKVCFVRSSYFTQHLSSSNFHSCHSIEFACNYASQQFPSAEVKLCRRQNCKGFPQLTNVDSLSNICTQERQTHHRWSWDHGKEMKAESSLH